MVANRWHDGSLSMTSSPLGPTVFKTPQCPWSVYSHMQTSAHNIKSLVMGLAVKARRQVITGVLASSAILPVGVLSWTTPNNMTARKPLAMSGAKCATKSGKECVPPPLPHCMLGEKPWISVVDSLLVTNKG